MSNYDYHIDEVLKSLNAIRKGYEAELRILREALDAERANGDELYEYNYQAVSLIEYVLNRCPDARKIAEKFVTIQMAAKGLGEREKNAMKRLNQYLEKNVECWMDKATHSDTRSAQDNSQ